MDTKAPKINVWFRYHARDFALRCSTLSLDEEGAYHRLLRHYWDRQQPLPNDDGVLHRLAGVSIRTWKRLRPGIEPLFEVTVNFWRLPWLDEEMERAQRVSRKRTEIGRQGGRAKAKSALANAKQLLGANSSNCLESQSQSQSQNTTRSLRPGEAPAGGENENPLAKIALAGGQV